MTAPDSLWTTLAALAVVGTERRPAQPLRADGPLGALLGALDPADAEGGLLAAAAAVALQRRAGRLPDPGPARPPAPCLPEQAPPCPPGAARHLGTMLSGVHNQALPEWLHALAASGRLAPPPHLPALLALGRVEAAFQPLILPVLGRRGRWLAALNPEWAYAAELPAGAADDGPAALAERWETSNRQARLALLQRLRAADPDSARALLEATWRSDRADERAAHVAGLAVGLSMADEPFLEAALDDRGATVRAAAADLLARLPASRLAARMAARAAPLLRWSPGEASRLLGLRPGRPPRIELALPDGLDKAAQRDGVELKSRHSGLGERAWWLAQIVGCAPPAIWPAAFGAPPAAIVRAEIDEQWRELVLGAWAEAALRYRDEEWAEALLALALDGKAPGLNLPRLIALLPAARQERAILALLRDHPAPLSTGHPALELLRGYGQPWSRELGLAVLDSLRRRLRARDRARLSTDWHLRAALETFARALPPELAREAATIWEGARDDLPYWGEAIERFAGLVAFRREMRAALAEAGGEAPGGTTNDEQEHP